MTKSLLLSFFVRKKRARDRTLRSCITSLMSSSEGPTSGSMLGVLSWTYTTFEQDRIQHGQPTAHLFH